MLDYIKGTIEGFEDSYAVIESGGIGYRCICSDNTLIHLQSEKSQVKLYVSLIVKENALELYGFASTSERVLFHTLNGVPKVGPKVALSILSLYNPSETISCIVSEDVKGLTRVAGVGRKLAESIVFNLKGRFSLDAFETQGKDTSVVFENASDKDEALIALCSLGFERVYSIELINSVYMEGMEIERIISEALKKAGEAK